MARQKYTWRIDTPPGWDVDAMHRELLDPLTRMQNLNRWVQLAELDLYDDHVLLKLTMTGHDRWWIRKRAPALIAGLATQSGIGTHMVQHVGIETPPTLKNARFTDEQGKRVFKPEDGSDPGPQLSVRSCRACRDPDHFHWRRGWKTGDQVQWGRGR
jgi:hypothetical protein